MPQDPERSDGRATIEDLEQVIALAPIPMLVLEGGGVIAAANDLVSGRLGFERGELIGRRLEALIPARFRAAHGERFEHYLEVPGSRELKADVDLWLLHKDGSELSVHIALKAVLRNGSTWIIAAMRDPSEAGSADDELRASERRFRIAASHTSDLVQEVYMDEDRMTYYGDIDGLFGYQLGEFPATVSEWAELVHPDDRAEVAADLDRAVESGVKTWRWRYRLLAADGSYRHLLDHGTFLRFNEDGTPSWGVGVVQDLTDQVLKERQLEDALDDLRAARERLADENVYLREELLEGMSVGDIVGDSEPWRHVMAQSRLVAGTDATVLITGETGTGKELLAWTVHAASERSSRSLITVNCGVLPSTLIESELFGHEKGAFSGADRLRKGRFELADGGTLFLDEIGELPLDLQVKLLRVLETGTFERLGSSKTHDSDVRIIAATNRDLREDVRAGRFRSDLYYRLMVFPIEVPPLRERRDDIRLLAMYFLAQQQTRQGKSIEAIPESTLATMEAYDWPGNVRELKNMIERAAILSAGSTLEIDTRSLRPGEGVEPPDTPPPGGPAATPVSSVAPSPTNLEDVERNHILAVLESCGWKVKGGGNAAERLGLKESTLRSRMKRLGITRP